MITSVEEYLNKLRKELAGCDPATIQDALADSEEHIRTALGDDPHRAGLGPIGNGRKGDMSIVVIGVPAWQRMV